MQIHWRTFVLLSVVAGGRGIVLLEVAKEMGFDPFFVAVGVILELVAEDCQRLQKEGVADALEFLKVDYIIESEMEYFNVEEGFDSRQRRQVVMVKVKLFDVGEAVGHPIYNSDAFVVEVDSLELVVLGMLLPVVLQALAQHKIYWGAAIIRSSTLIYAMKIKRSTRV